MAVRRTGSKAREAKEAKELARAVKLEAKEELLDAEVKPKRVKVGARARFVVTGLRQAHLTDDGVQYRLRYVSKAESALLRRIPYLSILRRSFNGVRLRRTPPRAWRSARQPQRRYSRVSTSSRRYDEKLISSKLEQRALRFRRISFPRPTSPSFRPLRRFSVASTTSSLITSAF